MTSPSPKVPEKSERERRLSERLQSGESAPKPPENPGAAPGYITPAKPGERL